MPTCLPAPTPSRQALLLDRQNAGSVPTLSPARCPPTMARHSTSRAAGHALGGERRLCRKFSFEVIWGMLSPDDPG
jgi:hypothetical protein